jgi:hypothetical protein
MPVRAASFRNGVANARSSATRRATPQLYLSSRLAPQRSAFEVSRRYGSDVRVIASIFSLVVISAALAFAAVTLTRGLPFGIALVVIVIGSSLLRGLTYLLWGRRDGKDQPPSGSR